MNDINPDNPDGVLPELEPLHKVLPAGGPLISGHPDYPMPYRECTRCGLRAVGDSLPIECPCTEEQIGACPLRSTP